MFSETGNLPVGGAAFFLIAYGLVSLFITGPMIGERTAEKIVGWDRQCRTALAAEIEAEKPAPILTPKLDCESTWGALFPQMKDVCRRHGNPEFNLPFMDQLSALENGKRALQEKRLALAVSQAGSRCDCAVSLTLEKRRVSLAIHAGSIRLVEPAPIKNFSSELMTSLRSSQCVGKD